MEANVTTNKNSYTSTLTPVQNATRPLISTAAGFGSGQCHMLFGLLIPFTWFGWR